MRSAKIIDYRLWVNCIELIFSKKHLTQSGFYEILSLKSALNLGLTDKLKSSFPNINIIPKPSYLIDKAPLNPFWVSGFTEGDGSFFVSISPKTNKVRIFYKINLNNRETPLLLELQKFFNGVGVISFNPKKNAVEYTVANVQDLYNIILPHFNTYRFHGDKLSNFIIWSKILNIVRSKVHLTSQGLAQVKELRDKLNKSN